VRRYWIACAALCTLCTPAVSETLRLLTVEYPPYFGESLENGGFVTDVVQETLIRAGYEVEIQFLPWRRALAIVRAGEADGIVGAYFTEKRSEYLNYTDLVALNEEVFIRVQGDKFPYQSLTDLKDHVVGVLDGSAQHEDLVAQGFQTNTSTSFKQIFMKLGAERIDAMLIGRAVMNHMLVNNQELAPLRNAFETLEPAYSVGEFYTTISKKNPNADQIVAAFNAALAQMRADGSFEAILARHGQSS